MLDEACVMFEMAMLTAGLKAIRFSSIVRLYGPARSRYTFCTKSIRRQRGARNDPVRYQVPFPAVLPRDPPVWPAGAAEGKPFRLTRLSFGSHTGTHIDAPAHLLADGMTVDDIPLALLIGHCLVVDLTVHDGEIDADLLRKLPLKGERRLLFHTRNSSLWEHPGFVGEFTALTPAAATFLVELGVQLVGIDYLSVEHTRTQGEVHRIRSRPAWSSSKGSISPASNGENTN
jgi:hypothetical protein